MHEVAFFGIALCFLATLVILALILGSYKKICVASVV